MIQAGLLEEDMKIEIEVTARKGSAASATGEGEEEEAMGGDAGGNGCKGGNRDSDGEGREVVGYL